jgi:hypothetical protein
VLVVLLLALAAAMAGKAAVDLLQMQPMVLQKPELVGVRVAMLVMVAKELVLRVVVLQVELAQVVQPVVAVRQILVQPAAAVVLDCWVRAPVVQAVWAQLAVAVDLVVLLVLYLLAVSMVAAVRAQTVQLLAQALREQFVLSGV